MLSVSSVRAAGTVTSPGLLARNLCSLTEAVGSRTALETLLATVDTSVMLELRLREVDLRRFDFGARMFDRLEIENVDLSDADLSQALVRELHLTNCTLTGARFRAWVA